MSPIFTLANAVFIPHGHCYLWQTNLVGLHVISDALIALAYYSISVSLVYFLQQRRDFPFSRLLILFSLFIFLCGTNHMMEIWTLWHPDYWVSGAIKALTALISLYTALALVPILPQTLDDQILYQGVSQQLQQEIEDRQQLETSLVEQETLNQAIFDLGNIALAVTGLNGEWLRVNPKLCQVLGYAAEEFVDLTWPEMTHPDDLDNDIQLFQRVLVGEIEGYEIEKRFFTRSGEIINIFLTVGGAREADGTVIFFVASLQDISDRKQAEMALEESRAMYSSILANISDAVFITQDSGDFTFICPNVETIFGYSEDEIAAQRSIFSLFDRQSLDPSDLNQQREITNIEQQIQDKAGNSHDLLVNIKAVDISGGTRLYTCRDISDRKQAERQLQQIQAELAQQESLFRNTFEQAAVGIAHVSPEGKFIRLNQRFCEIAGHPHHKLLPLTFQDITYPDDLEADLAYVQEMLQRERETYTLEKRYIRKDRSITWINLTVSLVCDTNQKPKYFIAVIEDINERKQTEIMLQDMREALNSSAIVAKTDAQGTITFVNDKFCKLSGYSQTELIGQNHRILGSGHHSDHFFYTLWKTISHGKVWRGEIKNRAKDGSFYWVDTTIVPFLNTHNHPYQYMAIRFDITDRKIAEQQLQSEISERKIALKKLRITSKSLAESNQELQDFAYVASHDLQEPLRKIQAFGDRLYTTAHDGLNTKSQDYLNRMLSAANRAQTLIQDLLAFSRVTTQAHPFVPTDLQQVLQGVLSDLEVRVEQTGATFMIDPLPTIDADAMQMRQIFQNLLSNALKFHTTDTKPRIYIQTNLCQIEHQAHYEFRVSDNGIGFEQQYADQIFQPFQRLHGRNTYEGSGIGLAICRKVARRHGGSLRAESSPGAGASFILTLPTHHPISENDQRDECTEQINNNLDSR